MINNKKICLVIPFWSGNRFNFQPHKFETDRLLSIKSITNGITDFSASCFLKKQIRQLTELKHSLDHIVFISPYNLNEPVAYTEYWTSLPKEINGIPLEKFERKNIGHSYGGLLDIYLKYRDKFDYYIFIEDDYTFVLDNFDKLLVDELERQQCDYLCEYIVDFDKATQKPIKRHATIATGIISSSAFKKAWEACFKENKDKHLFYDQLTFSLCFTDIGLILKDLQEYKHIFFNHNRRTWIFNENATKIMTVPIPATNFITAKEFEIIC
jgi:hypothetical protein